jgi:hypothetical protein
MRSVTAFFRLPVRDQRLVAAAGLWVVMVRLGLTFLPFQRLRSLLARFRRPVSSHPPAGTSADRIAWAVRTTSRYVPRASCLTQALAAQVLLARHGYPSYLRIGVSRDGAGRLAAHAWIECEGRMVIGGEIAEDFTTLPALEGESG